jgi:hypothetical protein
MGSSGYLVDRCASGVLSLETKNIAVMDVTSFIGRIRMILNHIELNSPSIRILYQVLHCGLKTPNGKTSPVAARSNRRLIQKAFVLLDNIRLINRFSVLVANIHCWRRAKVPIESDQLCKLPLDR